MALLQRLLSKALRPRLQAAALALKADGHGADGAEFAKRLGGGQTEQFT